MKNILKMNFSNSAQILGGSGVRGDHTGLFVAWEKGHALIHTIQAILHNKYKTYAKIGSRLPNNTAEIILYSQLCSGSDISGAKSLLERYLKLVNESMSHMFIEKKIEVIDLDVDEDIKCIVLDDSVNDSVSVISNNEEDEFCSEEGPSKNSTRKISSITRNLSQNKHSPPSNCKNGTTHSVSVEMRDCARKRAKRKHSSSEEDDIVEILDDDVIVLDDSISSNNNYFVNKPADTISVDLTINNSSAISVPNHSRQRDSGKPYPFTHPKISNISCISNSLRSGSNVKTSDNETSTSVVAKTSPKPSTSGTCELPRISNENNNSVTISEKSLKKVSKLKYKRPAHLTAPLISGSSQAHTEESQSNIYNPNADLSTKMTGLRPIVIDGNNVGISHGKGQFSLKGIEICINYFEKRGHRHIKAFLPHYRINKDTFDKLRKLEHQGTVVVTPSRKVNGKTIASYDDRYIVQYAAELGGVIVSTDNYRDLIQENPIWKETIEHRLLMFTWVDDLLMFPQDPLGRNGPKLTDFLKFPD